MKNLIVVSLLLACVSAFAKDSDIEKAGTVGFRLNQSNVTGFTSKNKIGFQGGVLVSIPFHEMLAARTGGLLVMRDAEIEASPVTVTANRLFLDIPATVSIGNDIVSGYLGANIGFKLSSSCSISGLAGVTCTGTTDEKSMVFQPVIGGDYFVTGDIKVGLFYEFETEYSRNWKQSAFGVTGAMVF